MATELAQGVAATAGRHPAGQPRSCRSCPPPSRTRPAPALGLPARTWGPVNPHPLRALAGRAGGGAELDAGNPGGGRCPHASRRPHRGGEERKGSWDGGTYLRCERPGRSHPRPSYSRRAASGVDTASAAAEGVVAGSRRPASLPDSPPLPRIWSHSVPLSSLPQPLLPPPSGTPILAPAPCLSLRPQAWRRPGRTAVGRADPSWRLSSLPPSLLSCPGGQTPERPAGGSPTLARL